MGVDGTGLGKGVGDAGALRKRSRQEYLEKRKAKKLQELKDDIEDEICLFGESNVSVKERLDLSYKKRVYDVATRGLEERDVGGYMIPEAYDAAGCVDQVKRFDVVNKREPGENVHRASGWEEQQLKKAYVSKSVRKEFEYDLVFDHQTEIIKPLYTLSQGQGYSIESSSSGVKPLSERSKNSSWKKLQEDRKSLPVYHYKESLLKAIEEHQVIVIEGETGSGKTTQIPQYLYEAGYTKKGKIGCTQPRRVAAISVAARVAKEMGVKLGHKVGYSIRFEDCTSDKTVLKYMTDGTLLREFLSEPDLSSYSVLIIDEAHERTVSTDLLFGLVRDIARHRPELKLLISSATLNALKFSDFFNAAPIFKIPGRRFPIEIHYTAAPVDNYVETAIATALRIHVTQPSGDILVFLTGQEEIETAEEAIKNRIRGFGKKIAELMVCPIYANLPTELQAKIFKPTPEGIRKVVLATIAETSLTIDAIKYVIDSGCCKETSFDPRTGMESLLITPISKASAMQRSGRSGRTGPGKCYRLYTKHHFESELEENCVPEIMRTDLTSVVLTLKSLGIDDLVHFDFMNAPPAESLMKSLELLFALGALNKEGELTKVGRWMTEFPLAPMLSKMIIASHKYKCSAEIISIAAMLSVGDAIFYRPKDKKVHADNAKSYFYTGEVGDHIALLNIYNTWKETDFSTQWCYENFIQFRSMKRARDIRDQLEGLLKRIIDAELTSNGNDHEAILKSITAGYFPHCAKLCKDGVYRMIKKPFQHVRIHPSSGVAHMFQKWVVYHELVFTSREYIRQVSKIKPEWIVEIAPHYYHLKDFEDVHPTNDRSKFRH